MVEDIIFNLVHEIDVEATQQKVEEYKSQNLKIMALNQAKAAEKMREEFSIIQEEEKLKAMKNAEFEVFPVKLPLRLALKRQISSRKN
jgi:hypothetical protein